MNTFTRQCVSVFATFFVAAGLFATGCAGETDAGEVSQVQVSDWIDRSTAPLLLDVRTAEEYASGHVPGAVNIPHDQLASRLSEIATPRDEQVIVYCERGGRAGVATQTLEAAGFTKVRHLSGDMSAWRDAGLPTE